MIQDFFLAHGQHAATGHWILMVIIWVVVFVAVWVLFSTFADRVNND